MTSATPLPRAGTSLPPALATVQRAQEGEGFLAWRALLGWELPAIARLGELVGGESATLAGLLDEGVLPLVARSSHTLTLQIDGADLQLRRDADQLSLAHEHLVGRARTVSRLLTRALDEAAQLRREHRPFSPAR